MGTAVHNPGERGQGPYEFALGDELRGERATLGKTLLDIQRDLRIKAAYIAAIEDAKPEVFPNPSFIAGYVRSYARYLQLDPDEVFRRFCQESGFAGAEGRAGGPEVGRREGEGREGGGGARRLQPRLPAGAARGARDAGDLAVGDRFGPGAGRPPRRARLRRMDRAAEHPAGAVRPGRGAAAGGGRDGPARPARGGAARRAGADRAREPGGGDGARRPLPPARRPRCRSWCRATARSPRSTRTAPACSSGPSPMPRGQ